MGQTQALEDTPRDDLSDELAPGHTLMQGQYTIDSFIQAGGFGITYLARNSLNRTVIIKECFPGSFCRRSATSVRARSRSHIGGFSSILEKFIEEAHNLAKVQHPNIVGVHQVFEENGTAYIALDFVEGRDLLQVIEGKDRKPSPDRVEALLRKVLDAIGAIHAQGMLHRDIAPDNIMLDADMEPVLIDFGAAREDFGPDSRQVSEMRVVKDGYSPQEFYVVGAPQGPFSDLYALAATFYHLITGEVPPDSQTRLAAAAMGEDDPYMPLSGRVEGYSKPFLAAIDKAMSIRPGERLQSARHWFDFLDETDMIRPAPAPVVAPDPAPTPARAVKSRLITPATMAPAPITPAIEDGGKTKTRVLSCVALLLPVVGAVYVLQSDDTDPAGGDIASALAIADQTRTAAVVTPSAPVPAVAEDAAPSPSAVSVPDVGDGASAPLLERFALGPVTSAWSVDLTGALPDGSDTIFAVNGVPWDAEYEVGAVLHKITPAPAGDTTGLSILAGPSQGEATLVRVTAPVIHRTTFPDGAAFETRFIDGAWTTSVTDAPVGSNFRAGDVLVGDLGSDLMFDMRTSLPEMLIRATLQNLDRLVLAIRRDGQLMTASLAIPS